MIPSTVYHGEDSEPTDQGKGLFQVKRIHPVLVKSQNSMTKAHEISNQNSQISQLKTPESCVCSNKNDLTKQDLVTTMTKSEKLEIFLGLAYLAFTISLGLYYLNLLSPSMANDLWWAGLNTSGAQSYLIDIFNTQISLGTSGTLDITQGIYSLEKDYSRYFTPIEINPTFVRTYLANHKENFPEIIAALRYTAGPERVASQYCWIDFNRRWEVAYTDKRQSRCNKRYTDNAALYWETIFRLIDWKLWMVTSKRKFAVSMGNYLNSSQAGISWMNQTAYAFQSIEKEIQVWKSAGFTKYQLQYTNAATWGIDETMYVENALGGRQALSTKRIAFEIRGSWTTVIMSWGPWNDYLLYSTFIRTDPTHQRFSPPCHYSDYLLDPLAYSCDPCDPAINPEWWNCQANIEVVLGVPDFPVSMMTRNALGPFGSIDLYFIPQPTSLGTLKKLFVDTLTSLMQSDVSFYQTMTLVPSLLIDLIPMTWQNGDLLYFGGDPTCVSRKALPYVQSSFAFDMSCITQERHTLAMDRFNTLFAIMAASSLASDSTSSMCSTCPTLSLSCERVLNATRNLLPAMNRAMNQQFQDLVEATHTYVTKQGISIIQYAFDSKTLTNVFLNQSILQSKSTKWNVFGWIFLYEWARGFREVVSFEGDNGDLVLISNRYTNVINEAQVLEVPRNACQYLWIVSLAISCMLTFVGILIVCYSIQLRGRVIGRNFFHFNRIVGAVWLSRPLLLVRGMTAIIILSTSPLVFVSRNNFSAFEYTRRSFIETMVISGESMWVSYVTDDFLLLLTQNSVPYSTSLSTCIGWVIYVIVDVVLPYQATTTIRHDCTIDFVGSKLTCTSGSHHHGGFKRVLLYITIQISCIIGSYIIMKIWLVSHNKSKAPTISHLLLSGTATAYLKRDTLSNGAWIVDRASCAMCGLLTYKSFIFDVKLWVLLEDIAPHVKWGMKLFQPPDLKLHGTVVTQQMQGAASNDLLTIPNNQRCHKRSISMRLFALAGLFYMCATIFGSVTYLTLTATNMANDFWWANYNISREHVFLARLFNSELILRPHQGSLNLLDIKLVDTANFSISSSTPVSALIKPLYLSQIRIQQAPNLQFVITGLRNMDACRAPWIAAQYCWLDLNKKWEMANSLSRQARCLATYKTNGAVYLEAVLRNVQWTKLHSCWGQSLEIGFHQYLAQSNAGSEWWNQVQAVTTSIPQEETVWKAAGIDEYLADWQNYKSVGLIDTFSIKNAFDFSYPMTLKHTNGTFTLASQTSMKMYWSLASDLWAITSPSTLMYGKSLVRNSPSFAFTNTSLEDVLVLNGTIQNSNINSGGFAVFRTVIGPFGSVDLKHVAIPPSLVQFVTHLNDYLSTRQIESSEFNIQYLNFIATPRIAYVPYTWLINGKHISYGANLLCPEIDGILISTGQWQLTSATIACGNVLGEHLTVPTISKLIAFIGTYLTSTTLDLSTIEYYCQQIQRLSIKDCQYQFFSQPYHFLHNTSHISTETLEKFVEMAKPVQRDLENLKIEIMHYASTEWSISNISFVRHDIFDRKAPEFHFIAWYLAYELAVANREIISFQGDIGHINIITSPNFEIGSMVNSLEIPVNVAYYIRYACLYVTCIFIFVAFLTMIYLITNKGYVEGLNLFELNRVAGIVWIGRTFLFIRSLAAICLLSTQVLSLEPTNSLYHFVSATEIVGETQTDKAIRLFKTFLAAGEVSWLVFVLNDILMVFTAQYTTEYVFKCNFMVWGLSAILSLALPTTHTATMYRECEMPEVDFQLICTSGTIAIGSFGRFITLITICIGSIAVCYLYERIRHPNLPAPKSYSLFLSSSAKYVYNSKQWIDHEIYYLDGGSAVINGILSFHLKNSFFIFDLKLWRIFIIQVPSEHRSILETREKYHLLSAIPLFNQEK